jgi:ATP-binding cassette subfamily B protein/subfamily B ATP-binding cassette protein MsbA
VFLGSLNSLGSGLITVAGTGVILWAGAQAVVAERITVGDLLLFLIYLGLLQAQVRTLANVYPTLQGLGGSVDRVMEVLESEPEIAEAANAPPLTRARGAVGFEGVTFGYEAGRPVLREITVSVQPGETVAIVGPTGAGKSTLAGLVPRFYDPWSGRVTLDGRDLRELRLGDVRDQVSLVMQEVFLFPMPVLENIGMGRPGAGREEIEQAARAARADEFIRRLPRGYDTVLGERGVTLSGGERQRLSIARALLKDAPVLILDEPTSALDAETEQSILAALAGLMKGRTTFLIAHRLSTIRGADRVLVLAGGRLVECGTPEELMRRGGVFARLKATQAGIAAEGGGE